jgi:hypothetical protein
MHSVLSVDTCVTVRHGCPMEYVICGDRVEFSYGGPRNGFHFAYDASALAGLVRLGTEALSQLDAGAETEGDHQRDEHTLEKPAP